MALTDENGTSNMVMPVAPMYGNGGGDEITYEDVIDYLFNNNRGGSYDVSE